MAAAVKYRVPYELKIDGVDIKSTKKSTNILYMRSGVKVAAPPAYGTALAGSDLQVFVDAFQLLWTSGFGGLTDFFSVDYLLNSIIARSVEGWTTGGIPRTIAGASNASPIVITTLGDHNLRPGDQVVIAGCLGNTAANGTWVVTIIDATHFSLQSSTGNGLYLGGGTWQLGVVPPRLLYGDSAVAGVSASPNGKITGQALPMVVSGSVRKISDRAGRNFRGGVRTGPHGESQNINGKWEATPLASCQVGWDTFWTGPYPNRAMPVLAEDYMIHMIFSRSLALQQVTPFTTADPFSANVTSFLVQPNFGSMIRRKPKLTAPIAS